MTAQRTPAELILSAVRTEKESSLFYRMMAEMTSYGEARDTLLTLSDDETSHAATLADLYYEITGRGVSDEPPARPEGDPNLFDLPSASRREALEFALQNEINAVGLYQSQADVTDDPRIAKIFRILADTERGHAAYLRLQISRLDTSNDYDQDAG